MTFTYALRSHKSLKPLESNDESESNHESNEDEYESSERFMSSSSYPPPHSTTLLSPTLFKNFTNLAATERERERERTPNQILSPSKTSSRSHSLSKNIFKSNLLSAPKTSTIRVSFATDTAADPAPPSKLENSKPKMSLDGVQAPAPAPDFTVWEDPSLDLDEPLLIKGADVNANAMEVEVEEEVEVDGNGNDNPPDAEESKENKAPIADSDATPHPLPPRLPGRIVFSDLKVSGMQEYQELLGKAFHISLSRSPKPMFNQGRPTMPSAVTAASPFLNFPGLSYSESLPAPSKLTRTHGSGQFRATSIDLFRRSRPLKDTLYMDEMSPSTPHKLPVGLHSSRVTQKRVFPVPKRCVVVEAAPGAYNLRPRTRTSRPKMGLPPSGTRKKRS